MTTKDLFGRQTSPPHPGEVLREDILPHYTMTRAQLAKHLQISTRLLNEVVRERRDINLDLAMRLGAAFGQGAHFWLGLQMQHDLWQARNQKISSSAHPALQLDRCQTVKNFPRAFCSC